MKTSIIVALVWTTSATANDIPCTEGSTLFQSSVVSTAVIEDNGAALIEDNGAAGLDIKDSESEAIVEGTNHFGPVVPQQCNPHEAAQEFEDHAEMVAAMNAPVWQRRHKVLIDGEVFIDRSLEEVLNEHDEDINKCKRFLHDGRSGDHWTWETWHGMPYTTESNPPIKVCGNSMKITLFEDRGCHRPVALIGSCDAFDAHQLHGLPPATCCEYDPSDLEGFMPGSYMVESCGPYAHYSSLLQPLDPVAGNQEPLEAAHPLAFSQMVQPHSQSLESMEAQDEGMLVQTSQESGEGKQLETLSESKAKKTLIRTKLDNNQKVYIQNQPVLGDGAGEGALGKCRELAAQHVSNPDAPHVRVCGTHIKATFYLRGRCENYYEHSKQIGQCETGMPASTCDSFGPSQDPRFGNYQSYSIRLCRSR